jgi:hypothetical protein
MGGISEIAGFVRLPVHRPAVDDDDRASPALLRIGATAHGASLWYGALRPSVLGGLSDLCLRPHAILGSAHDFGRGTRPYHERLRHDRTVVSFCPADVRTSRSTTSQPVKLSSAFRLLVSYALPAFSGARRTR